MISPVDHNRGNHAVELKGKLTTQLCLTHREWEWAVVFRLCFWDWCVPMVFNREQLNCQWVLRFTHSVQADIMLSQQLNVLLLSRETNISKCCFSWSHFGLSLSTGVESDFAVFPDNVLWFQGKSALTIKRKATVILLYFSDTSPAIITQPEQSQRMRAFSLFQSQMKCHSQEFQMLEISSFVFIPYLHKSQNRIPLKGISPTVCFKCKTNKFPTRVLRFRFQWKCRVNQMWKYHRAMNISL